MTQSRGCHSGLISRSGLRVWLSAGVMAVSLASGVLGAERPPNFVIIFADDLGYGDLGCYGHPTIRTPCLDVMAAEGMRFTDFYSAAPVCTPSRTALLTGRLPIRSGMVGAERRVLASNSTGGLPESEITIAQALKAKGYATACVGKWHLGHLPQYLPTKRGFDSFFGLPYSNDMKPTPLIRGEQTLEEPVVLETLTERYTKEAVEFIVAQRDKPFFLYLAHTFPHTPLKANPRFAGKSPRGLYGDVVEEVDWSVGQVLKTLRAQGLAERTLVMFSSDNGPWLIRGLNGGSAGLLRDGKGSTFEGGMREPGIFWWLGQIKPSVNRSMASTMDVFPTLMELAGVDMPSDREYDGRSLLTVLRGGEREEAPFFYYDNAMLMAVRKGPWKACLVTRASYGPDRPKINQHDPPLLYHLGHDPSEKLDVAKDHADVVADLLAEVQRHQAGLKPGTPQFDLK
ncbi:MAG: sulfatase [Phycisphaerae bacterium]|nr:sulfatase [Phycisphaerae bacterium]